LSKKILISLGIVFVVAIAGVLGYRAYASNLSSEATALQTTTVQIGSVTTTLSSSGNTRSGQNASITWETSGKVGEITLKQGDLVQEDQLLAALDPGSYAMEVINARQESIDAQQALENLLNSKLQQALALQAVEDAQKTLSTLTQTSAEQVSQAQLALATAQDALKDAQSNRNVMNFPHTTDELIIEKAETDYLLAKAVYKEALQQYTKYEKKSLTNPDRVRALTNMLAAKQKMDTALATYNWYLLGYSESEIAQADANLAVAQANLEKAQADWELIKDGASTAEIMLAEATLADAQREWERVKDGPTEADIAAAQAAVDAAQAVLDRVQLVAPFAGTITEVKVKTGDLVNAGETAFRIDDLANLYVDLQVSEVDYANVAVGQEVILEFDAISDKEYAGEVTEIGMIGTVSQGVVNYPVTVKVNNADGSIRPGMTTSVTIVLAQVDDVLVVPNRAIRTTNGQKTVTILFEGQQIIIPVAVGLVGDTNSEVISDQIYEGDTLVVNGSTSTTTSTTNFRENFVPDGGGMMGPGMMP
jgi:HlyD family secretion protein